MENFFRDLPVPGPDESIEVLTSAPGFRIERIVSRGHHSPEGFWFDQSDDEWVLLLAGAAAVAFDNGHVVPLAPGDWLELPAHVRHRVAWTDPSKDTIWLAVYRHA
jgi:cupin 2 domain-containing protein